jgi:SAM-dependent methyltransferase
MDEDAEGAPSAGYSLALSEQEQARYRRMAEVAVENESADWTAAGILEGARIADIGCGPGAVLRVMAERVGSHGHAIGIDADQSAVAMATQEVADLVQAHVQLGTATDTGLDSDSYHVVMCRHVLAHNGGNEAAIVSHLASLARPGGCVYLVDIDAPRMRIGSDDPDVQDLFDRYHEYQRSRGNDLSVGLRLADLLTDAGLFVERYASPMAVRPTVPGLRPPGWAARAQMLAEGFATDEDITRWENAYSRLDAAERRPWFFPGAFIAVGRRLA